VLGSSWPRYVSAHGVVLNYRFETGKNAITARSEVDKSFEGDRKWCFFRRGQCRLDFSSSE
jgi:hypothetical protein